MPTKCPGLPPSGPSPWEASTLTHPWNLWSWPSVGILSAPQATAWCWGGQPSQTKARSPISLACPSPDQALVR